MNEHDDLNFRPASGNEGENQDSNKATEADAAAAAGRREVAAARAEPRGAPPLLALIPSEIHAPPPRSKSGSAWKGFAHFRLIAATAAGLAVIAALGAATLVERHRQAQLLAERTQESESLAQTVRSLKARLDGLETAKSREDSAELRRAIGDMKSSLATARDLSGALALLSQRVDRIDHEESARVDKLSEHVDRENANRTAELAARLDKIEKKIAAPAMAALAPAPQTPEAAKLAAAAAKPAQAISPETTGSIEKPKPILRGFSVIDAHDGVALIAGRYGPQEVRAGDVIAGAGRVDRIERRGRDWAVVTNLGIIAAGEPPLY